ncbi:MAG: 2TM domain-containing protein [Winogradskyella sp.]|uniref:2TM domain-containing protein n=1 Tax=Winogradskyella sp. TaxID=1883156 RepID=UPI0025E2DA4A|nr:2TM domain-containing protein [Winogradskyella sp.]NRB83018.1 2TM domain-containing protein [Winogradskyella sp.]
MTKLKEEQLKANARKKVRRIKTFYLHLALYLICIVLILYNFIIIEEGPYKDNIISLNLSIIVAWTAFILIHGFIAFKESKVFSKSWEQRKMSEFSQKDESERQLWE